MSAISNFVNLSGRRPYIQFILLLIIIASTNICRYSASDFKLRPDEDMKSPKFEQCKLNENVPAVESLKQKTKKAGVDENGLFLSEGGWCVIIVKP